MQKLASGPLMTPRRETRRMRRVSTSYPKWSDSSRHDIEHRLMATAKP